MFRAYSICVAILVSFTVHAREAERGSEKDSLKAELAYSAILKVPSTVMKEDPQTPASSLHDRVQPPAVDLWHQSTLTGSWDGLREEWIEKGISFSLGYKADNLANLTGGLSQHSTYMHNVDFITTIDFEKAFNWQGASFLLYAIHNNGAGFSKYVGDQQSASNIDIPGVTKVHQILYRQSFMRNRLSFAIGLYDLKTEFYVTHASRVFLNNAFGVGTELSQTASAGVATFPNSSVAALLRLQPSKFWSFQFAGASAVPGKSSGRFTDASSRRSSAGAFVIGEAAYTWFGDRSENVGIGKYTVGAWLYTSKFDEVYASGSNGRTQRSTANNGVYVTAEQKVYSEHSNSEEGLSLFTRLGVANGRINQFDLGATFGAVYTGLLPGREQDKLGIALAHVSNSKEFQESMLTSSVSVASAELAVEITYRAELAPWLVVQPDLQRIIHPGTTMHVSSATTFGTRIEIGF
jgi:porin